VIDLEFVRAEGDLVSILQPAVGHDILQALDAVFRGLSFDALQERQVVLVRADDIDAELFLQFLGAAGVVQMTVGQPDFLDLQAVLLDYPDNDRDVATGIDDHPFLRIGIEENGAVLLEGGYRNDAGLEHAHECLVSSFQSPVSIGSNAAEGSRNFRLVHAETTGRNRNLSGSGEWRGTRTWTLSEAISNVCRCLLYAILPPCPMPRNNHATRALSAHRNKETLQ